MPPSSEAPEFLRPYIHHGVQLTWKGEADAIGECPFCNREKKFFVSQKNGMYDCKICDAGFDKEGNPKSGGNVYTFIRKLHIEGLAATTDDDLEEVAADRGLLVGTLKRWGLVKSVIDGEWLAPAYGFKGNVGERKINNLYKWAGSNGKRSLMVTATLQQCLFGMQFWDMAKPNVMVWEGLWDAAAIEEGLRKLKAVKALGETISLANTAILGVPGCGTFRDEWVPMFRGKNVWFGYDSDHPRYTCAECQKTYSIIDDDVCPRCKSANRKQLNHEDLIKEPVGFAGMKSAIRKVAPVANKILYLAWGPDGYDPMVKDGYDSRDHLHSELTTN